MCIEPWNKSFRHIVLSYKKEFNKLVRKKYRQFRHKMLKQIVDSNENSPDEFWRNIKKLKKENYKDPSSNIQPKEWFDYFNKLMNGDYDKKTLSEKLAFVNLKECSNAILNNTITAEEVTLVVKSLKNNKACGSDGITNEMLKIACVVNIDVFVKLFNLIFKSGVYPSFWREHCIKPIFKDGCCNDPLNYRGIALSSCLSKFFLRILHNRLEKYLELNNVICHEQIGFRKGNRTSDHILTLKTIIDKAFKSSKRIHLCFIEFRKVFDTINRGALFFFFFFFYINY